MPNYIGIDYGLVNIGIAVGQSITNTAAALSTIHQHKGINWQQLDQIIQQWLPAAIIIGKPVDEDGKPQPMTKLAHDFANKIYQRYQIPVHEMDERYSSMQAQDAFANARKQGNAKRKHGKNLDAHAAKVILQRWLDSQI